VVPDPKTGAALLAKDLPVLHRAAVADCDTLDGVKDGIIMNPTACRFDASTVERKTVGQTGCLSRESVAAAKALYAGAHDAKGRKLVIGGPQPGSELSWEGVFVPRSTQDFIPSAMFASDMLRSLGYWRALPPGWNIYQFRFTTATLEGLMPMHGLYDATDPDLSAFARRGGKLLMWHGWSDPHILPLNSIAYSQAVSDRMGTQGSRNVMRLFLISGLYHCGGGDGLTSVDVLTPLVQWVEGGRASEGLVVSRTDADAASGKGRMTYAWPATSVLVAGEDAERPASWREGPQLSVSAKLYQTWAGARLFEPGYQQECGFDGRSFTCWPKR
jgi:Tannase and feruloyl esterase